MQKLETIRGTLIFIEVPKNIEPYRLGLFIQSMEWLDKGGSLENYPFSELDKCKEYEIVGEVTESGIGSDCGPYESSLVLHSEMELKGIVLSPDKKFIVLKELDPNLEIDLNDDTSDDDCDDNVDFTCNFCEISPSGSHALNCPNNNSPFSQFIQNGYD